MKSQATMKTKKQTEKAGLISELARATGLSPRAVELEALSLLHGQIFVDGVRLSAWREMKRSTR